MTILKMFAVTAILAVVLSVASNPAWAGAATSYQPVKGDKVVVYIHHFKPADYEKGRDLVEGGFAAAISEHGQVRRTFFLENPESQEVMAVSFFHPDSSVEKWHDFQARKDVLEKLAPLRSEPLIIKYYTVGLHHVVN